MSNFAKRIRKYRLDTGLTQKEMATKFGLTESHWKKYELGKRTPTFEGLIALADYFDVSIDYLVGRSDNPRLKTSLQDEGSQNE